MSSLIEVAANLVAVQASITPMSIDQILSEIGKVHKGLTNLESGQQADILNDIKPIANKEYFLKNEVACMVCGKRGFKTLGRHLTTAHNMSASMYRKQFGIPNTHPLTSKNYSQTRRKLALDRGLADNLVKARAVRMANIESKEQTASVVDECSLIEVALAVGS